MIVTVVSVLAVVAVVGPRVMVCLGESKTDIATITVMKLVHEAFPQWQHSHRGCPQSLDELSPYMDNKDTHDPWGSPYGMTCRDGHLVVYSRGEDRVAFTADDIWSNR